MTVEQSAMLNDLYHVPEHGKAELIKGELVLMSPTGDCAGNGGRRIYRHLRQYLRNRRAGVMPSPTTWASL